ncbi:protein yippee-like At5g53940 isoform X1 [Gossypium arboreum]|uniref:Protein yippee-like n=1 Tax=Gossypium hirsutum TaxID=3635 RepID=A0A1U8KGY2_GOSHI|nr:protein yippee-like At5g53940 isoform X1 [Gossypium hirsutum]XP_052886757.1 protein yippee-like At5g53940 isoform X1 [Gossypium arboreum]XP_052886761.1 protein yippee-like At5g53940 isoform X1 [Gossypium arboreum]
MGRIFVVELDGRSYRCKFCRTHLALPDDLVSRSFHCRRGKAYLFNNANESSKSRKCATFEALNRLLFRIPFSRVNITVGALEERVMLSGMHTVADIFCCCCGQIVGWKYEAAHEKSQKYKEGKFVLERLVRSFASDRGRIVDEIDFSSEVYIDTRPSMSDGEDA